MVNGGLSSQDNGHGLLLSGFSHIISLPVDAG